MAEEEGGGEALEEERTMGHAFHTCGGILGDDWGGYHTCPACRVANRDGKL